MIFRRSLYVVENCWRARLSEMNTFGLFALGEGCPQIPPDVIGRRAKRDQGAASRSVDVFDK